MTAIRKTLEGLSSADRLIFADDDRMESYREDTMMRAEPDAVLVARDEAEVAEALRSCHAQGVPITICGSQTSMTGASVADGGLLVSTEKLEGIVDIAEKNGEHIACVRPGTVVADLQRALADEGLFYPVAPTSRDECRIGANVATNATGEDSYKYGPVRRYVRRLEIVLPTGERRTLERATNECISDERNRAGYFVDWTNPIDLIIGSEGTLAYVDRIWLSCLEGIPRFFAALLPFPSNRAALDFVLDVSLARDDLNPRTLELVDSGALERMKSAAGFPTIPDEVAALLYIKQEYADDAEMNAHFERWYEAASSAAGAELAEQILIATTPTQQEEFRLWRHRIPEAANEVGRAAWAEGGGKVGSDWWVPLPKIHEILEHFYGLARASGMPFMAYAHIGNGHPHTNLLARNADEKRRALEILADCCRKAVALGGGVAGEHGIGKLHADQLPLQHDAATIERMRTWKREYDPKNILGRGNIFAERMVV